MKSSTLFKIILISNACLFCVNVSSTEEILISESPSDRYENVLNKSIGYIQYFFTALNELEGLKKTTEELICSINKKVKNIGLDLSDKKEQSKLQNIINRLEILTKKLTEQIDKWETQLRENNFSISLNKIDSKVKIGDYDTTIDNLIKLYGYIVKLTTRFNTLKDQTTKHIENISHDIANINTTMKNKEKITREINRVVIKLNKELRVLTKAVLKEIENCKLQLEDISKKNAKANKIVIEKISSSNKKSDSEKNKNKTNKEENKNNKKNKNETEVKQENKNNEKDNTPNNKKSENKEKKSSKDNKENEKQSKNNKSSKNEDDKKDDEKKKSSKFTLDNITDEEIVEYFRNRKNSNNNIDNTADNNNGEDNNDENNNDNNVDSDNNKYEENEEDMENNDIYDSLNRIEILNNNMDDDD